MGDGSVMHSRTALTLSLAVLLAVAAAAPGAAAASAGSTEAVASVDGRPIAQANGTSTTGDAPDVRVVAVDHSPRPITYGREMEVEATIHNRGGSGTDMVQLLVDEDQDGYLQTDEIESLEYVEVDAGEWTTVRFTYTVRGTPGEYRLAVASDANERGYRFEVTPDNKDGSNYSITAVEAPETVAESDELRVNATVENVGDNWFSQPTAYRVDLNGDGRLTPNETVDQQMSVLGPRYVETVHLTASPTLSPGTVRHGVFTRDDSWTGTLTVTAASAPPDNGTDSGDGSDPDSGSGESDGDGDGDGEESNAGDGDGDGEESNAGDGDGDGEESNAGDGDGDESNAGDGDGEGDGTAPEDPDEGGEQEPGAGNGTPTDDPVRLSLAPDEVSLDANATSSVTLRIHNATEGLEAYDLFVRTDDAAAVEIVDFDPAVEARVQASPITDNGSAIRLQGAKVIDDGTGVVRLGTVEFSGADTGAAVITTDTVDLGYSSDDTYTVTREGSAIVRVRDANSTDGTPNGTGPDPVEPVPGDRVSLRLTPVDDGNDTVEQNGSASDLTVGANRTYELVASNLTDGLEAATLRVVTTNSSAVAIVDGKSGGTIGLENQTDRGSVTFNSVHRVESGTATLGRITVAGRSPGEANVTARDVQLYYDGQTSYEGIDAAPVTVSVAAEPAGPPPVVGDTRPTDPDEDGLYEDVDGDGEFTILDVSVLLNAFDEPVVRNNAAAFDFDDDGTVTIIDVSTLLNDL
jgi:hypothetical protein